VELEEYHVQLGLEMSAREDPEAMQIEVAKKIFYWVYSTPRSYSISPLPTLSAFCLCYFVVLS
jgi:hypothetical protein